MLKRYITTERRLPLPQRRAMRKLYLQGGVPTNTLQNFLGGIEYVKMEFWGRTEVYRASKTKENVWRKVKSENTPLKL